MTGASFGWILALVVACAAFTGCGNEDCAAISIPALRVQLRDAVTGEIICDGVIHLVTQAFDKVFQCSADAGVAGKTCCDLSINGPSGRAYEIEATANGYDSVAKRVFVPEKECGQPVTQDVTLEMYPQ